jgi:hypothetical protein
MENIYIRLKWEVFLIVILLNRESMWKKKQTLMVCLLMPLMKTVGYRPIIEPMIEDKIMKLAN